MANHKLDIEIEASLSKFKKDLDGIGKIVDNFTKTIKQSLGSNSSFNSMNNATKQANAQVKDMTDRLKGINGKTFKVKVDQENKSGSGAGLLAAGAVAGLGRVKDSIAPIKQIALSWSEVGKNLRNVRDSAHNVGVQFINLKRTLDHIKNTPLTMPNGTPIPKEMIIDKYKLQMMDRAKTLLKNIGSVGVSSFKAIGSTVANVGVIMRTSLINGLIRVKNLLSKLLAPLKAFLPILSVLGAIRSVTSGLNASMDNEETVSMFFQAFKSGAETAKDRIDNLALALGLNTTEMYKGAAGMRVLIGNMVGSAKEADNMSLRLTELAADMSSFYNVDNAQVLDNLKSGLSGQSMALRKYGIDITGAKTAQERFNIIMNQTKDAQGDLARTQDSLANQTRRLKNAFKDLSNSWGDLIAPLAKFVIPYLIKAVMWVTNLFNAFSRLFGGKTSSGVKGIVDDSYDIADGLGDATDNAKALQKQLAGFDELNVIGNTGSDSGASGGVSGGGFGMTDEQSEEQKSKAEEIAAKFDEIAQKIKGFIEPVIPIFMNLWTIITRIVTETLPEWFQGMYNTMERIGLLKLFDGIFDAVKKLVEYLAGDGYGWIDKTLKLFLTFSAASFVVEMVKATVAIAKNTVAWIVNFVTQAGNKIGTIIAFIVQTTSALLVQIPILWANVAGWVALNLPIIAIIAAIGLLVAAFVYCWNKFEGFRNFFLVTWDVLKTAVISIGATMIDIFKKIGQAIIDTVLAPFKLILWAIEKLTGFKLNIKGTNEKAENWAIGSIPMLAKGGYATGASLAMIGEGRHNEAVLPLSDAVFSKLADGITSMMDNNTNANLAPIVNIIEIGGAKVYEQCIEYINGKTITTGRSPILV